MTRKFRRDALVLALLSSSLVAMAGPAMRGLRFANETQYAVSVTVDGALVCNVQPGATCRITVTADVGHLIHFSNGIQEGNTNYAPGLCSGRGEPTWTFLDSYHDFECL